MDRLKCQTSEKIGSQKDLLSWKLMDLRLTQPPKLHPSQS